MFSDKLNNKLNEEVETKVISIYQKEMDEPDPWIGTEIEGIRKTKTGWVWQDPETKHEWWYYQRAYKEVDNENRTHGLKGPYWYRKRRLTEEDSEETEVKEEYVGMTLPFNIPDELRGGLMRRKGNQIVQLAPPALSGHGGGAEYRKMQQSDWGENHQKQFGNTLATLIENPDTILEIEIKEAKLY